MPLHNPNVQTSSAQRPETRGEARTCIARCWTSTSLRAHPLTPLHTANLQNILGTMSEDYWRNPDMHCALLDTNFTTCTSTYATFKRNNTKLHGWIRRPPNLAPNHAVLWALPAGHRRPCRGTRDIKTCTAEKDARSFHHHRVGQLVVHHEAASNPHSIQRTQVDRRC